MVHKISKEIEKANFLSGSLSYQLLYALEGHSPFNLSYLNVIK